MDRHVLVLDSKAELIRSVGERIARTLVRVLAAQESAHIVLTGGSVGIGVLEAFRDAPAIAEIDFSRVHVWWGDERWVPAGHSDRNDRGADDALLSHVSIPVSQIHRCDGSDAGFTLEESAARYAAELRRFAAPGRDLPHFDLLLLGVGPDGHIASLFPDRADLIDSDQAALAVRQSPKPPSERISMSLDTINSAERVWMALAGADKAPALGLALAGASKYQVPASAARGTRRTVFFVDVEAAAEVPAELIAREY